MKTKDRSRLIHAAMGRIPCDLTVQNVQYLNVFTGEIYPAEVDILDGFVVRVRPEGETPSLPSAKTVDGKNLYLIPGFIDTHMHVESTMMIPSNLSRAVVPWGTTTICTDPHEIGNVLGIDGVRFMLEDAKRSSLRQYVLAPSCVPAVPGLENSGAVFTEKEIGELLDLDGVVGIAELMDYCGICSDCDRMHAIIDKGIENHAFLQGHAPFVTGKELDAYRIGGPLSDHESELADELIAKLRVGMHINLRASSLVNHIENLVEGIKRIPYHDFISICTDDVHASDLLTLGHVNKVVRYAIECGLDPVDVIRMATINAAREYGFDELGAVAPGYVADFQLVEKLDGRRPKAVYMDGEIVAEDGIYIGKDQFSEDGNHIEKNPVCAPYPFKNTMQVGWISGADAFSLHVEDQSCTEADVNVIVPLDSTNVLRRVEKQTLPVIDGRISLEGREDLAYVCVINRHGKELKTVAVMQDFGILEGAIGTTISHDSHNVVLIYKNAQDALCVLRALERAGGGMCVAKDETILACMELPVAGLMSLRTCEEVAVEFSRYEEAFYEICRPGTPLLSASIMSLTALPGIIVTDCGLVDGNTQQILRCVSGDASN